MIALYSGTPGSGKSLHQAEEILFKLKHKKVVYTNYSVNVDLIKKCSGEWHYLDNSDLTPIKLVEIHNYIKEKYHFNKVPEGFISLYIDECQILFNSRTWQQSNRQDWLKFFSQHRKYGFNVYLISQSDKMIDRQIRSLIEYEYKHRMIGNFGFWGMILSIFLGSKTFVAVQYWYGINERLGAEIHHVRKKYYKLYDSYNTFEEFKSGNSVQSPPHSY